MPGKTIKLFKIASEINIGKETIVEYLQGKGFDIQNKPIANLTSEMVDVVYDKFKKEKKAAEVQREKVQKHKDVKKPVSDRDNYSNDDSDYYDDEPSQSSNSALAETIAHAPEPIKAQPVATKKSSILEKLLEEIPDIDDDDIDFESIKKIKSKDDKPEVKNEESAKKDNTSMIPEAPQLRGLKISGKIEIISESKPDFRRNRNDRPQDRNQNRNQPGGERRRDNQGSDGQQRSNPNYNDRDRRDFRERRNTDTKPGEQRPQDGSQRPQDGNLRSYEGNREQRPQGQGDNRGQQRPYENRGPRPQGGQQDGYRPRPQGQQGQGDNRGQQGGDFNRDRRPGDFNNRGPRPQDGNQRPYEGNREQRPYEGNREQRPGGQQDGYRPRPQGQGDNRGQQGGDFNRDRRPGDFNNRGPRPQDGNQRPYEGNREQRNDFPFRTESVYRKDALDKQKTGADANTVISQNEPRFKKRKTGKEIVDVESEVKKKAELAAKKGVKKGKKSIRESIKDEDITKAIRETLADMADNSQGASRAKVKAKRKVERNVKEQIVRDELERKSKILELTEFVTTQDIANLMKIPTSEIILKCMQLGLMVTINQRLDKDTILLIASDYGFDVAFQEEQASLIIEEIEDTPESLVPRYPIVTIMGHVDHGKTSLLDYLRNSKVVAGESGGITQHIGAYRVETESGSKITFLDTPGHQAFTAMRARGAQITDIVILVVAADDQVMPQTKEAISHAQAANVPIVVAINKMDKAEANPEKIKQQLSEEGILVEEWGGKYQCVEISAKKGTNIDKLLESILLEAEILELKANPDRDARGTVVEAHMDKGLGAVATVIIQKGTLKVGDIFVCGSSSGKVRAIFDERDNRLEKAIPSQPVRIIGFDNVPDSGDLFIILRDDSEAKYIANERGKLKREQELRQIRHITLDDIAKQISVGGVKNLNIILKCDVGGSLEALSGEIHKLSHDEVKVVILHKAVGQINESDIQLAVASNAVVIGFHTEPTTNARRLADKENVEIRTYEIIYECLDDINRALEGMLKPKLQDEVIGEAEVRAIFKIGRVQKIAGCKVISGKLIRNSKMRILRDGLPIYEGKLNSLKREKDDVREVNEGFECGIMIDQFNDWEDLDIIQTFQINEIKRKISDK